MYTCICSFDDYFYASVEEKEREDANNKGYKEMTQKERQEQEINMKTEEGKTKSKKAKRKGKERREGQKAI